MDCNCSANKTSAEYHALITENVGLVYSCYWKLRGLASPKTDCESMKSEGLLALVRAARAFDPTKGTRFSSYAFRAIYNAMLEHLRHDRIIKLPTDMMAKRKRDAQDPRLVRMALATFREVKRIDSQRDMGETFSDLADAAWRRDCEIHDAATDVSVAMACLPRRKRQIVAMILDGRTNSQIAHKLRVTRERVRQIIAESVKMMREAMVGAGGGEDTAEELD